MSPVVVPFAPAATLIDRFPTALLAHLQAHEVRRSFSESELAEMDPRRLAKTASRSVIGVKNEYKFLADVYAKLDDESDLLVLSMRLAATPCGPLDERHISPTANSPPSSHRPRTEPDNSGRQSDIAVR